VLDSDTQNCGVCGRVCGSDEFCSFGNCTPQSSVWLATGLSAPEDIALDETTVYWTSPSANLIQSIDKNGGSVIPLASSLSRPRHLALDDAYVYWSDDLGGAIMRTLKDGSGTPEIVTPAITPLSIVVDSTSVYWTTEMRIMQAPKLGGASTVFAEIPPTFARSINDMISDGDSLFVMETFGGNGGHVWRVELRDGSVSHLQGPGSAIRQSIMALDSTRLYSTAGELQRLIQWVNKSDGLNRGLLVAYSLSTYISPTACDILWTEGSRINLSLRGLESSSRTYWPLFTVPDSQGPVRRMAVDQSNVYWTSGNAIGTIPAL
jgi:hypothetical protein